MMTKDQETALFGPEDHEAPIVSKHTPGPWHPLCESSDLEGNNWQFTIGSEPRLNNYGGQVATVGWKDLTREQTEANARLIAAAPVMYEALLAIRARINGKFDHPTLIAFGPLMDIDSDVEAIAKAAIAKAEGEITCAP